MLRRSLVLSVIGGVALLIAGCGSTSSSGATLTGPSYKVGLLLPLSGTGARTGTHHKNGAQAAIDEINASGGVDGHRLEALVKDDQAKADVIVSGMREMSDAGVGVVIGGTLTPNCLAANTIAQQDSMVLVSPSCASIVLTTTQRSPNYFQVSASSLQLTNAAAVDVSKNLASVGPWDTATYDFAAGRGIWNDFKTALTKREPSVGYGTEVFIPLNTTQFGPFITSLTSAAPAGSKRGLMSVVFGSGGLTFFQQGGSYDLDKHYAAILAISNPEPSEGLGAGGPTIHYIENYYATAYNNTMNSQFISDYKKLSGGDSPDASAMEGYTAVRGIAAAMKKAGSADGKAVLKVLPDLHFDSPPAGTSISGPGTTRSWPHDRVRVQGRRQGAQGLQLHGRPPGARAGDHPRRAVNRPKVSPKT